jgi:diguanylate cyclase (GGDEF)-like protein
MGACFIQWKVRHTVEKKILNSMTSAEIELYFNCLRSQAQDHLYQSNDPLTGLPNGTSFRFLASEEMLDNPEQRYAIVFIDFSDFKIFNDFYGRTAGDTLLKSVAAVLFGECKKHVIAARFFVDKFVLLRPYQNKEELVSYVNYLDGRISDIDTPIRILPFYGLAVSDHATKPVDVLIDEAKMAQQPIKGKYYEKYAFFDRKAYEKRKFEKTIEADIIEAMAKEQLFPYIQPIADMVTGDIVSGEALMRWKHPKLGILAPGDFMSVLEKNGQIIEVDMYIYRQVFSLIHDRLKAGRMMVPISINLSRMHVFDKEFRSNFLGLIKEYRIPHNAVYLELTESGFLEDGQEMYNHMEFFRKEGFKVAMDDYGTGYSTMEMLWHCPMDEVKIDRGFIDDISDPRSRIVLRHIIDMLRDLDIDIITEGVETEEQRDLLLECGCRMAQGYYYYKPMPVPEFLELLEKNGAKNCIA